jgi:uncharacterized protein YlaN (UPF0358 family)
MPCALFSISRWISSAVQLGLVGQRDGQDVVQLCLFARFQLS